MKTRVVRRLDFTRKVVLAIAGTVALTVPVVLGIMNAPLIRAQSQSQPPATPLAFEVVSVKANKSGGGRGGMRPQPTGIVITNLNLKFIIQDAFSVEDFQISGGPNWIENERYDIAAKAKGPITTEQRKLMVQTLLADRFHLSHHRETKEYPVYALVVNKNGPKLHPAASDTTPQIFMKPTPTGLQLTGQKSSMQALANLLTLLMHRTVIDRTGIVGDFDFKAEWVPDQTQVGGNELIQAARSLNPDQVQGDLSPNASGTSLTAALQEQMGLKLEAAKGPVQILVIDHVERPAEN